MANLASLDDARIAAALERGDIEGAALLAAKLPKPAHYLAAMEEVFRVVKQRMGTGMIELERQEAKLTKYNPRPELHGQDPKPAADIQIKFNAASGDILPQLHPTLRSFLFHKNGAVSHDLVDSTHSAPDLRFPKLVGPFEWLTVHDDATLIIHKGIGGKSDLTLPASLKKPVQIAPQQGGTVIVTMQVQCHPSESQAGSLYILMGQPITVSFVPGDESEPGDDDDSAD